MGDPSYVHRLDVSDPACQLEQPREVGADGDLSQRDGRVPEAARPFRTFDDIPQLTRQAPAHRERVLTPSTTPLHTPTATLLPIGNVPKWGEDSGPLTTRRYFGRLGPRKAGPGAYADTGLPTALLDSDSAKLKVSTGLPALDDVLDALYWGDNVVWDLAAGDVEPFYAAITRVEGAFDTKVFVSLDGDGAADGLEGVSVLDAGPTSPLAQPIDLLREIQRLCRSSQRRLLLFDSLDEMVRAWGANNARGFFARCCPFLLEVGAVAYWAMSSETPVTVRETVHAVTQCVLRMDERAVRVVKAEGREDGVTGSMLHWHVEDGQPVLEPASITERVAASLRAVRRTRELGQQALADLAGVTPSAISQAERAERGLSLSTLARLTAALGITIDDLIHGEDPGVYRIGRRVDDPEHGAEHGVTLLGTEDSDLRIDLVQLGAREEGRPLPGQKGSGIVAVARGLVQVQVAGLTPAVRHGEVLVADTERVERWRNLGQSDALLFWIVISPEITLRPHRER